LRAQVVVLQQSDVRAVVRAGGSLEGISVEALRKIEHDIREQERLIHGFVLDTKAGFLSHDLVGIRRRTSD
jgi:hypothetical protein